MKRKLSCMMAGIAVTLTMLGTMLMSSATAHAADSAADCLRADNVWVVVQDNDKTPQGACATSFSTGYDAMVSAGFDVNGEGFVCQINGAPATCSLDDAWWSYWHLTPNATGWDSWEFSELGLSSYEPKPGTVEGWRLLPWERDPAPPVFTAPDLDAGDAVAPSVLTAPSDMSVEAQSDATFSATVNGVPRPTLQWETSSEADLWKAVPDATTSTFTLPSVTEDDDGLKVRLVATNSAGTVTTTPVTLTVRPFSGVADIPDEKFRECLTESLSQSATASITTDQLGTLTDVSCFFKGVTNLTGAEHLTSLTSLDLTFNKVTDVAPLANLGSLTTLNLDSNQVADITPLAGGTALTSLDLDKNGLTSLQGISSMTGLRSLSVGGNSLPTLPAMGSLSVLEMLDVSGNPLTSLDAAATLPALTTLLAYNTEIADITAVAGMESLEELNFHTTAVADLAPLRGLNLAKLNASGTQVSDLSPLTDTTIETLNIRRTKVTSLAPLAGTPGLTELSAQELGLISVEPLAGLPLTKLYVHDNALSDLSPLKDANLTSWGALDQAIEAQATVGVPFTLPSVQDREGTALILKDAPEEGVITYTEAGIKTYPFSDTARKFTGKITVTIVDAPEPTQEPSIEPTAEPTQDPSAEPTKDPATEPTKNPTTEPTKAPTTSPAPSPLPSSPGATATSTSTPTGDVKPTQGSSSPGTNTPTPPRKSPDHPIGLPNTGN